MDLGEIRLRFVRLTAPARRLDRRSSRAAAAPVVTVVLCRCIDRVRFIRMRVYTHEWQNIFSGIVQFSPSAWGSLQADDVTAFVTSEAETKRGFGRKAAPVAIRAVLRFLVYSGEIRAGLEAAVPTMRNWKHAALPRHVSTADLDCVLKLFRDASPQGRRNRAIILSLARLGLRANEIVQLRLEDIDWRGGRLIIRRGKNRIERVLPLSQEVGNALAEYVIKARPRSGHRAVFLNYRPPYRPLAGPSAVSTMANRALLSIGLAPGPRLGAHNFRHTVASEMVSNGATFKEVADVLGHQSLQTTGIYAKLDLQALATVALPWIGVEK